MILSFYLSSIYQKEATSYGLLDEIISKLLIVVPDKDDTELDETPKCQTDNTREAAFEEQQRLGSVGQQLTGLIGGYPAQATFQTTMQQPPSPLQSILGIGGGIASILGALNTS